MSTGNPINSDEFFRQINHKSNIVFNTTITSEKTKNKVSNAAQNSIILEKVADFCENHRIKNILESSANELKFGTFCLTHGFYRQSLNSARLSLELWIGSLYFSIYEKKLRLWYINSHDISWSKISCKEEGVISKSYIETFFKELENYTEGYQEKSKDLYRKLSEYIHGNHQTIKEIDQSIDFNESLVYKYCDLIDEATEIMIFFFFVRYGKDLKEKAIDLYEIVDDRIGHVQEIRELIGGTTGG